MSFEDNLKKKESKTGALDTLIPPVKDNTPPTTVEGNEPKSLADEFREEFQQKLSRPRVEDTHTRSTFLVRDDLLERLDDLAYAENPANKGVAKKNQKMARGFKSDFINKAISRLLDEYEGKI